MRIPHPGSRIPIESLPVNHTILLLPGDGIGPEVVSAAARVLRAVADKFGHTFELPEAIIGAAALRRGLPPLPPETLAAAQSANALLLGAVGHVEGFALLCRF